MHTSNIVGFNCHAVAQMGLVVSHIQQQRGRPDCADVESVQCLCYSLNGKYNLLHAKFQYLS